MPFQIPLEAPLRAEGRSFRVTPFDAMLAQFFGYGVAAGLWAGSVPFVSQAANMTTADIGFAFTIFSAGYILAMTLGGKIMTYAPPRRILLIANPLTLISLAGLLLATSPLQFTVFLTMVGIVMGLIDLVMNTEGTLVEADLQRPILARLHCLASSGTAAGALAGSVFALTLGPYASVALAAIGLGMAMIVIWLATPDRPVIRSARDGIWSAYSIALLLLGLIFGIDVAGESAASIWSARLLNEQAPQLAVIAGIGVSFFAGCQAIMRFMGDRLRHAFGDARLIMMSLGVATIGFAVVGFSNGFTMSVVGFALVGTGTALQVPCLFALAAGLHQRNSGAALSFVSAIAGGPRLLAPLAFGEIATRWSTGIAFGTIAAAFMVAIGLAIIAQARRTTVES